MLLMTKKLFRVYQKIEMLGMLEMVVAMVICVQLVLKFAILYLVEIGSFKLRKMLLSLLLPSLNVKVGELTV